MEYFLENIARSLYSEFGNSLNRHCLVFPNRRAGLYFMKYLSAGITGPVWAPAINTVNDLFIKASPLQVASGELLLFELYRVYRKLRKSAESFDDFYFWGDMLLDDFDDVDKYLVTASQLFRNVLDYKNIDQQFRELTEEQVAVIRQFWINFDPGKPTREKSGFTDIWTILVDLYTGFRDSLRQQNMAYEGMIFRDLAENKDDGFYKSPDFDMYHFIGFNALNECEKVVMQRIRSGGKARFYWDYDNSYIRGDRLNSAGYFMRENLKIFGNDMPRDWNYDTHLSSASGSIMRRVIETSSDVAQVKLIPGLIARIPGLSAETAHHTAVVLADENLIMPVLTSLPENSGDINITMGYPLKHSQVYALIRHLIELQRKASVSGGIVRFGFEEVTSILRHPLMAELLKDNQGIADMIAGSNIVWITKDLFAGSPILSRFFSHPDSARSLAAYFKTVIALVAEINEKDEDDQGGRDISQNIRNEFIYRVVLSLNRLETLVNSADIAFSAETYMRILDKLLKMQSVPFSGEPLSGIQIMGILETRALDFSNLIILSVNEGVLPSISSASSFIPFSLREAFGLPSMNHRESVYAYHFYRLLHRAANVTFLYNSNAEGLRNGEMSRFLLQMKYDPLLKPEFLDLGFEIKSRGLISEVTERTEEHARMLRRRFLDSSRKRVLSPTAINTWLNCRMKFYYRYVNGLKEPEVVSRDIDPAMLGEILHDVMRTLYSSSVNRIITEEAIDRLMNDSELLGDTIVKSINSKFSSDTERKVEGNELIIRDVLMAYVMKILATDRSAAPFTIIALESDISFEAGISSGTTDIALLTGGKADRIDMAGGVVRVVDYKTGTVAERISSIGELFADDRKKDPDAWLQTLLYCEAYLRNNPGAIMRPAVYSIRKMTGSPDGDRLRIRSDSRNDIVVDDYESVREEFNKNLKKVIGDIFNDNEPFRMTTDIRGKCSYCPYRGLCLR